MSVFHELLAIKRYREQQAEMALRVQRSHLQALSESHARAERDLADFQQHAREQEARLYNRLCRQPVRVSAIHHAMACVQNWKAHADTLRDRMHELLAQREQAQRDFNAAREHHRLAGRATEKFVDLAQSHDQALLLDQERKEDMEMEEVASLGRDRDEWAHTAEAEIA